MQHSKPVSIFGGEPSFIKLQYNDKLKNEYCSSNRIKLIRIPYTSIKDINLILDKEIK